MKIAKDYLILVLSSLVITFIFFQFTGWYEFGTMPTTTVLSRLFIFFALLSIMLCSFTCWLRNR